MPKQNGDPTLREIKQRHANELCEKANEIFRLKQTIAAMTETAEEANRSYISQHNQIQELQAATLAAEARIRELEELVERLVASRDGYSSQLRTRNEQMFRIGKALNQHAKSMYWEDITEGAIARIGGIDASLTEHKENQG